MMKFELVIIFILLMEMVNTEFMDDYSDDYFDGLLDETNDEKSETERMIDFLKKSEEEFMQDPNIKQYMKIFFQIDLNKKEMKEIKLIQTWERKNNVTFVFENKKKDKKQWRGHLHRKLFYQMVLEGKEDDLRSLKRNSKYSAQRLRRFAFDFDVNIQGSGYAQIVGGYIAVAGGIIGAIGAGMILAPITGGASLVIAGLSAGTIASVGAGVGIAGGVVAVGGSVGEIYWTTEESQKAKQVLTLANKEIGETAMIISMIYDAQEKFAEQIKNSTALENLKQHLADKMILRAMQAGFDMMQVSRYLHIWKAKNLITHVFFKQSLSSTVTFKMVFRTLAKQLNKHFIKRGFKAVSSDVYRFVQKSVPSAAAKGWIKGVGQALTAAVNIGVGIWDIYTGERTIQGIGNIGDVFRITAIELENKVEDIENAYEQLTRKKISQSTVSEDLNIIEIHTCDETYNSGAKVDLVISTVNEKGEVEKCQTEFLKVDDYKNKWNLNLFNLGNCTNFLIFNFTASVTVKNTERATICIDYMTFATGGKFVPSMVCSLHNEIGKEIYTSSSLPPPELTCARHPSIARIKTHTCKECNRDAYTHTQCWDPETDDKINLDIKFLNENNETIRDGSCRTSYLNSDADSQFYYDAKDIHRIDILGDCKDKIFDETSFSSFETIVSKLGRDDWCVDILKIYTPGFFKDFSVFKCDVSKSGKGTIFNKNTEKVHCPLVRAANPKLSIEKIEFHTCPSFFAGTSAADIKVKICDSKNDKKCCMTNIVNYGRINSGSKYTIDGDYYDDDGGERLGDCESFPIFDNALLFKVYVNSINAMCLTHISFFGKDSSNVPFMKCDFANDNLWMDSNLMRKDSWMGTYWSNQMLLCEHHSYTHITKVSFKMCDLTHAGTESSIRLKINSGGKSCITRVLDSYNNDFERGDYNEFPMSNQDDCGKLKVEDSKVTMHVINTGSDHLCLSQTVLFTSDGKGNSELLDCRLDQDGLKDMDSLCSSQDSSYMWSSNCSNSTGSYIPLICS